MATIYACKTLPDGKIKIISADRKPLSLQEKISLWCQARKNRKITIKGTYTIKDLENIIEYLRNDEHTAPLKIIESEIYYDKNGEKVHDIRF